MQRERVVLIVITLVLIVAAVMLAPHTLAMNDARLGEYLQDNHITTETPAAPERGQALSPFLDLQASVGTLAMIVDQP